MRGNKRELVLLYFDGVVHKLPYEIWFLCLEISGLVRVGDKNTCMWWNIHIPRFVFSKDLVKWSRRKNQPG